MQQSPDIKTELTFANDDNTMVVTDNSSNIKYQKHAFFNNNFNTMTGTRTSSSIQQEAIYAFQLQQDIARKHGIDTIFYRIFSSSSDSDYFDYGSFLQEYKEIYADPRLVYAGNFFYPENYNKESITSKIELFTELESDFLLNPIKTDKENDMTRIIPYSQIIELANGVYFCLQKIISTSSLNSSEASEYEKGVKLFTHNYEFFVSENCIEEITALESFMRRFIKRKTKKSARAYLVGANSQGYTLSEFDVTIPSDFNDNSEVFDLIYGDKFHNFNEKIIEKFNPSGSSSEDESGIEEQSNIQPGILLLHGDPGTGKTTYIRYLTCQLQERYERNTIFMTAEFFAAHINNPSFIEFFKENIGQENSAPVVVIEDAESIINSRESVYNSKNAVSTLLNMTDGLLRDALNIQIIATFNTHIDNIDSALVRAGRLIGRKNFKKMSKERAFELIKILKLSDTNKEKITKYLEELKDSVVSITEIYAAIRDTQPIIHDYEEPDKSGKFGFH